MAVGSTQPPTEMSTRNISWRGKGGQCEGLTTLPPSCADCHDIWEPQPPGTLRASPGLYRDYFTFTFTFTGDYINYINRNVRGGQRTCIKISVTLEATRLRAVRSWVRISAVTRYLSLLQNVQNGSGAHPAF